MHAAAVLALMQAGSSTEGACSSFGGGGAFHEAGDTWGVVTTNSDGAVADVGGRITQGNWP